MKTVKVFFAVTLLMVSSVSWDANGFLGRKPAFEKIDQEFVSLFKGWAKQGVLKELRALHPAWQAKDIYHNYKHSRNTAQLAYQSARRQGMSRKEATFLAQVALIHDVDPDRDAKKPARVKDTVDLLVSSAFGAQGQPSDHEQGMARIINSFGWDSKQVHMAQSVILRTEFPFNQKDKPQAVKDYTDSLRLLGVSQKMGRKGVAKVMRMGAMLSEWADKGSWYIKSTKTAETAVQGLDHELKNAGIPRPEGDMKTTTYGFLSDLGERKQFSVDVKIARDLKILRGIRGRFAPLRTLGIPVDHKGTQRILRTNEYQNLRQNIQYFHSFALTPAPTKK